MLIYSGVDLGKNSGKRVKSWAEALSYTAENELLLGPKGPEMLAFADIQIRKGEGMRWFPERKFFPRFFGQKMTAPNPLP